MSHKTLRPFVFFLLLALRLAVPGPTQADEVHLLNGDRLTGEIVGLADGRLAVSTEWAGTIEIDWSAVRSIASDGALTLVLDDGSRLVGRAGPPAGDVEDAVLITPAEVDTPVTVTLVRVTAINPPAPAVRWTGNASAGLVAHRGNTETRSLYLEAEATARTEDNRYMAGAQATRAEDDGETTADSSRGWIEVDHFFGERWYLASSALFTRDEFQDLRLRSSVALSTGYQVLETTSAELSAELGASYVDEDSYDAEDRAYTAGRWAFDLRYRWAEGGVELFHNHEGFLDLEESGDTLVRSKTGVRANLFGGLIATAQVNFDYDGEPAPGRERQDWRYLLNLGFEW